MLEVFDAKPGLFVQPRKLTLIPADPEANVFPLKTGDFPLASPQKANPPLDPRKTHVVLQSQRVGDFRSTDRATREVHPPLIPPLEGGTKEVAERPIVIK